MHAIRTLAASLVMAGIQAGCVYAPGPYGYPSGHGYAPGPYAPPYDPYPSYYFAPPVVLGFGFGFEGGYGHGHRCWHCGGW